MEVIEEYQELIERDAMDISFFWKYGQLFLYILIAVAGYICTILYYIFWQEIFSGHCPLWSEVLAVPKVGTLWPIESETNSDDYVEAVTSAISNYTDWKHEIIVSGEYQRRCHAYYIINCCSCAFAIIWAAFFFMCGKGGHDARIFVAPWRIVIPALLFNLIFSIMTFYVTQDMEKGYITFTRSLYKIYLQLTKNHPKSALNSSKCAVIQDYVSVHNIHEHNVCGMYVVLEILSWTITWCWTIGLIILILRIIQINDFRLLKVKVYEISDTTKDLPSSTLMKSDILAISERQKEKQG